MEQLYSLKGQIIDPKALYVARLRERTLEARILGVERNKVVFGEGREYPTSQASYEPQISEQFTERQVPLYLIDQVSRL